MKRLPVCSTGDHIDGARHLTQGDHCDGRGVDAKSRNQAELVVDIHDVYKPVPTSAGQNRSLGTEMKRVSTKDLTSSAIT